jgi:hypothetical protein
MKQIEVHRSSRKTCAWLRERSLACVAVPSFPREVGILAQRNVSNVEVPTVLSIMAPDIPSDIRAMIIDLAERPTLVSLRLVSRAWSSLDETPLFRLISMHVGTKDDLKRHQDRMETLETFR